MNELVVNHNDLNGVPLRTLTEKEQKIFFAIVQQMRNKGTEQVVISFDRLKEISGWDNTLGKRNNTEFVQYLENVSHKIARLTGSVRSQDGLKVAVFSLFPTFLIDGEDTQTLTVRINTDFKYILNNLKKSITVWESQEFNKLSNSYSQSLFRLLKQYRTTGFYRVSVHELRLLLSVPESYTTAKMHERVFSKSTVKDLSNVFRGFKIKQERGAGRGRPIIAYTFTFQRETKDEYEKKRKQEEETLKLWDTNESQKMPSAKSQTEYQNPELRKEREEIQKNAPDIDIPMDGPWNKGLTDTLKGWFKK